MKKKVLIVNGQQILRSMIEGILQKIPNSDFEIIKSGSAPDAMDKIIQFNSELDLIIADADLPVINGFELHKRLNNTTPFILLVSALRGDDTNKYLRDNKVNYLVKPFSLENLSNKINVIFQQTKGGE